jgi:hypothetical protein
MTEKMVRCARCHDVFDATDEACPRCGTKYEPLEAAPTTPEGFFVDKYKSPVYEAPLSPLVLGPAPRSGPSLLLGAGVAFIVVALVFSALVYVNAFGSSPAPTRQAVVARSPVPTAVPTLPASIARTLAQFADPKFSAHITVSTRATVSGRITVTGQSSTVFSSLDATVAAGDEAGTLTIAGVTTDFLLLNNQLSLKTGTAGHYKPAAAIPPYYLLLPLFDLTGPKMLQYAGDTTGTMGETLNHLTSTAWWTPDKNKLAVLAVSGLPEKIEKVSLDLYVTPDGTPVSATFTAWTDATNGEHLVQVITTYKFLDVGTAGPIVAPSAS